MSFRRILAVLLILLLVAAAVADAKSRSGGSKLSGFAGKSLSSPGSMPSVKSTAAKAAGLSVLPTAAKSVKKSHIDADDVLENETPPSDETGEAQESPDFGALSLIFAGVLAAGLRRR